MTALTSQVMSMDKFIITLIILKRAYYCNNNLIATLQEKWLRCNTLVRSIGVTP